MNKVKNLYSMGHAKWYNSFKLLWNWLVSTEAEVRLEKFLRDNVNGSTDIIELGCGTALNLKKILSLNLRFKTYSGLDFSEDMLSIARHNFGRVKGVEFHNQDLSELDTLGKKADIILCTWVLSHLNSPAKVINQAQRRLRPGGKIFLIFLSKPKWYVNFWFCLVSKYIFQSKCLSDSEINKINNVTSINQHTAKLTTSLVISN